jgi:hypothetical protein
LLLLLFCFVQLHILQLSLWLRPRLFPFSARLLLLLVLLLLLLLLCHALLLCWLLLLLLLLCRCGCLHTAERHGGVQHRPWLPASLAAGPAPLWYIGLSLCLLAAHCLHLCTPHHLPRQVQLRLILA